MSLKKRIVPIAGAVALTALALSGCSFVKSTATSLNYFFKYGPTRTYEDEHVKGILGDFNKDGMPDTFVFSKDNNPGLYYFESNEDGSYTVEILDSNGVRSLRIPDFPN